MKHFILLLLIANSVCITAKAQHSKQAALLEIVSDIGPNDTVTVGVTAYSRPGCIAPDPSIQNADTRLILIYRKNEAFIAEHIAPGVHGFTENAHEQKILPGAAIQQLLVKFVLSSGSDASGNDISHLFNFADYSISFSRAGKSQQLNTYEIDKAVLVTLMAALQLEESSCRKEERYKNLAEMPAECRQRKHLKAMGIVSK